jgi:hypothetical protein
MTEALEEGCGFALNRVLDVVSLSEKEYNKQTKRADIVDRMVHEVEVAIYDRFEVPYPDDTQTAADLIEGQGISPRGWFSRRLARYLLKRGGLVHSSKGP